MFVDMPRGFESLCKSGSNPILASEVLERIHGMVMELQRHRIPEAEPQLG